MAHTESNEKKTTATLTIDGRQVTVPAGTTILDAAAQLGIRIPTLCWLKKVSTTGACRICIVKVEGVERFMTACNTPVKDGISVISTSPELEAARKKTLELMLVNHPLDCPVCDAAGECDLQDTCYGLNVDKNKFSAALERLPIRYDWKLLESDPNRCILCEKCVKVCREVVGREAIEIVNRGDNTIIDTISGEPLDCDFCGNCINVCPTGTLISKPFKFRGRPWSFQVTPGICTFCSSGCQIEYHARDGRIERVTSSDDSFNRGNLCVNGRFGYAAFNSAGRLSTPLMQDANGEQKKSSWDQALGSVAAQLKELSTVGGGNAIAGIGSPRITNEESYLFQKLMRGALGSNNIDSEARLGYLPAQVIQYEMLGYSGGTRSMDAIEQAATVICVGADLKAESPGFAYRVIQAVSRNDAKLIIANNRATSLNKFANSFLQYRPGSEAWLAAGLNKAILAENLADTSATGFDALQTSLDALSFEQIHSATGIDEACLRSTARLIGNSGKVAVLYGNGIMRSADLKNAVGGVVNLALLTGAAGTGGAGIFPLDEKNNTQGMLDMGVCPEYLPGYHTYEHAAATFGTAWNCSIPTTAGKDLFKIIDAIEAGEIKALYVIGCDLLQLLPDRNRIQRALNRLELLIVQDMFLTATAKMAHVVLPAAGGAEKAGSFTSVDNRVQCFEAATAPAADSRTDADILSKLYAMISPVAKIAPVGMANLQHEITRLTGLYSESCDHSGCRMGRVKHHRQSTRCTPLAPATLPTADGGYRFSLTIGPVLHHNGSYTTWSDNNTLVAGEACLHVSAADAAALAITCGDMVRISSAAGSMSIKCSISSAQQPGDLFIPAHAHEAKALFSSAATMNQPVSLSK